MRLVGNAPSLLTRHVPGVFHSRSNPASNTFPNGRNEIEIDRFKVSKRDGRAGEIRTRGLLVPNQALCRAKLPPVVLFLSTNGAERWVLRCPKSFHYSTVGEVGLIAGAAGSSQAPILYGSA